MVDELHANKNLPMVVVDETINMTQSHGAFCAGANRNVVVQTKCAQYGQIVLLDFIENDAFYFLVRHRLQLGVKYEFFWLIPMARPGVL